MSLPQVLHLLGAGMILGVGLFALWRPEPFARATGFSALNEMSVSEIRAGFGGVMTGLALFAVWVQDDLVYAALGAAFVGATAARWIDLARGARNRGIWIGLFSDAAIAILLLFPS